MFSLDVVSNAGTVPYTPTMKRDKLKRLTARIMRAGSLKEAARIVRRAARNLSDDKGTWGYFMRRLAVGLEQGKARFKVFQKGNSKLPFYSFSTLPQYTCPGAGSCLKWCYSFTGWRYPAAWCRQVQNTLFLRFAPHIIQSAFKALPHDVVIRLYVDGDFDSVETVRFWFYLLRTRPDLQAYGYSKSWSILRDVATRFPEEIPGNYVLNLSNGGKDDVSREEMLSLPFTRGEFIALQIDYRPAGVKGNVGSKRYKDPAYHAAVYAAAEKAGLGKVFSCPGRCGECIGTKHACGVAKFGRPIVIGVH